MAPTPRGSAVCVDTKILVYASSPASPFHDAARKRLSELGSGGASFWTSRKVLREYLASMTRPVAVLPAPPLSILLNAVRRFEMEFQMGAPEIGVPTLFY